MHNQQQIVVSSNHSRPPWQILDFLHSWCHTASKWQPLRTPPIAPTTGPSPCSAATKAQPQTASQAKLIHYFPCQHPRPHQRKVSIHVTTANSTSTTTVIHTNKSSSIHQSQSTQSSPETRSGFSQQPPRSTTVLTVAKSIRLQQPPLTAE